MNIKFSTLAFLISLTIISSEALAGPSIYLRADTAYVKIRNNNRDKAFETASTDPDGDFNKIGKTSSHPVIINLGIGYQFSKRFRSDINFTHFGKMNFKNENSDVRSLTRTKSDSIMANLYYELDDYLNFIPYATAGVGISYNKVKYAKTFNKETNNLAEFINGNKKTYLAWQVGAGSRYNFDSKWGVDLGYRYIDLGKFQTGEYETDINDNDITKVSPVNGKVKAHLIQAGLFYNF